MENQTKKINTQYNHLFIGGEWMLPSSNAKAYSISPFDQSQTGYTVLAAKADIDKAVTTAKQTFNSGVWSNKIPEERQAVIARFNELHKQYSQEFAQLTTSENGSPLWFTSAIQQGVVFQTEAYLQAAKETDWEKVSINATGANLLVRREPVGVVAAIIPWNAPQQSALVKIIPALLAGCTVVFKPTPETALNGIALGEIFMEAGLPKGVLSIVPADREVSEYLVSHPLVDKIAFTGSTRAGQTIASIAGRQMKRASMELGGKSAGIILEDADINLIAGLGKYSAFTNNGQSCAGITRLLVPESRYGEITEILKQTIESITIGNPQNPNTFLGPVYNEVQYDRVRNYIQIGLDEGAELITGGLDKPEDESLQNGWFVKPTLFANVNNKMRIAQEEIFGPVQVLIPYKTLDEAIAIANDSEYGLSGSVITNNIEKGLEVAKTIRTGTFMVNAAQPDFSIPFGGYKQSGVGREFGTYGLHTYTELKSISY
ncbi:acyl-CoA reductase-like NAD-dependent aldehyde dehydrogenase [Chryseobacterium rhizosphaerae]|jgi:acyl-CoA reductase-like NAD-dependent aldehyde dehydrogenase|uniref:aldehyde dehydrogenase n=1 Tax=Chryseobacterium rhizosphaerae TaxID=395937 RepID=UPI000647D3B0|nr:aldehyde dehydrogenase [Chryseobacterium rhizosphaerae]MDR6545047.1 acyl-CoA reductase-like NAD-dependent aldehyde dehydrogenase [Chryseobacterium rhizosphaerae]